MKRFVPGVILLYFFFFKQFSNNSPSLQLLPSVFLNGMNNFSDLVELRFNKKHRITQLVNVECENENTNLDKPYNNENINISHCSFYSHSQYSSDGSVIYVYKGNYYMEIYCSMFYNCSCSSNGGAVYFYSTYSVIKMVCANRCSATIQFHFAYLRALEENCLNYLSVSYCSPSTTGSYPIWLQSGIQRVDNTNSSMNCAFGYSGIVVSPPTSLTSSFCTFSNNYALRFICIYFYSNSGTMSYANIVHNNSPSNYGVIYVYGGGSPIMKYCNFYQNQNTLFFISSGKLEVCHSYIHHTGFLSKSIEVSISNNNSFITENCGIQTYQIQFFKSFYCFADIQALNETMDFTLIRTLSRSNVIMFLPQILLIA